MITAAKNTYHSYYQNSNNASALIENRCIFSITPIWNFRVTWADSDEQFRVLPFPKYEAGESTPYRTFLSMWHTQYGIPADTADADRSAAVMEYLGYASYNYVTPTVFEEVMKLRYSANSDCSNMFDIMRNGRTYGVASLFYMSFTPGVYRDAHSMFRNAVLYNVTGLDSYYKTYYKEHLEIVTEQLNAFYSR